MRIKNYCLILLNLCNQLQVQREAQQDIHMDAPPSTLEVEGEPSSKKARTDAGT